MFQNILNTKFSLSLSHGGRHACLGILINIMTNGTFTWLSIIFRSWLTKKQPPEMFYKKVVLKNFAIFAGKHLCWNLFLIKFHAYRPATFLKRDSSTGVSVNIERFLRTPILKNMYKRLLLSTQPPVSEKLFCLFMLLLL